MTTPLTQKLREATSAAHRRIDDALNLTDPDFDRAAYSGLLTRWYGLLLPFERAITKHLPQQIISVRRKTPLLLDDLRCLRVDSSVARIADENSQLPAQHFEEAIGSFYVIEGSTLGAQYLSAHFSRTLGVDESNAGRFFAGYGANTKARWLETKQLIDAVPEHQHLQVIDAANRAFEKCQQWLTGISSMPEPHALSV